MPYTKSQFTSFTPVVRMVAIQTWIDWGAIDQNTAFRHSFSPVVGGVATRWSQSDAEDRLSENTWGDALVFAPDGIIMAFQNLHDDEHDSKSGTSWTLAIAEWDPKDDESRLKPAIQAAHVLAITRLKEFDPANLVRDRKIPSNAAGSPMWRFIWGGD